MAVISQKVFIACARADLAEGEAAEKAERLALAEADPEEFKFAFFLSARDEEKSFFQQRSFYELWSADKIIFVLGKNALSDEDMYLFAALTALRACSYRVTVKAAGENMSRETITELFLSSKTKSAILQFLPYARLHFGGNALDKYLTAEQMLEEVCSFLCKNEEGEQDDEEEAPPEEGFDEEWQRSMQEDAPPAFCEDEEDQEYQGDEEDEEYQGDEKDEEGEEDEEEIPDDDVDLSEPQESGERIEMFRRSFLSKMLRIKMETDNKFRLEGDKLCSYCGKEKQVTIGGIRQIAAGAFLNLLELEEISMDDTVELIETGAIFGCPKLAKITYNGTKEQWQRVEKRELWHDREKLEICCSDGKLRG